MEVLAEHSEAPFLASPRFLFTLLITQAWAARLEVAGVAHAVAAQLLALGGSSTPCGTWAVPLLVL